MSNGNRKQAGADSGAGAGLDGSLELSSHHDHDSAQPWVFKIIVIGDSNVGKTCLTCRFCGGTFMKNPEATIGVDFRERSLELDGVKIKVRTGQQTCTLLYTLIPLREAFSRNCVPQ